LLEQDDLGTVARGAPVLGADRHHAALAGGEGERVVAGVDREVAASDETTTISVVWPWRSQRPSPPPRTVRT
jgi:hypothetical protein